MLVWNFALDAYGRTQRIPVSFVDLREVYEYVIHKDPSSGETGDTLYIAMAHRHPRCHEARTTCTVHTHCRLREANARVHAGIVCGSGGLPSHARVTGAPSSLSGARAQSSH